MNEIVAQVGEGGWLLDVVQVAVGVARVASCVVLMWLGVRYRWCAIAWLATLGSATTAIYVALTFGADLGEDVVVVSGSLHGLILLAAVWATLDSRAKLEASQQQTRRQEVEQHEALRRAAREITP